MMAVNAPMAVIFPARIELPPAWPWIVTALVSLVLFPVMPEGRGEEAAYPLVMLEVLGPNIAAVNDDHIFFTTGNEKAATDSVSEITGVKPAIRRQDVTCGLGIFKIPRHDARSAHKQGADISLRQFQPAAVTNLNFISRQRFAAIYKGFDPYGVVLQAIVNRYGSLKFGQMFGIDIILFQTLTQR